jgi:enamine deaminase RidA (YjgF/YER057c/UK114 family)
VKDGKIEGKLVPTGIRPTFMEQFKKSGVELPKGEFGIPPADPKKPTRPRKGRWLSGDAEVIADEQVLALGKGRSVKAGGMVYVTSVGPIDPDTGLMVGTGVKDQTRQCLKNLKQKLEDAGSSLEKVVWANWALKEPTDFDIFNEEWLHWFPVEQPVGQGTLMPPAQRRAGFRVSLGVIAEA